MLLLALAALCPGILFGLTGNVLLSLLFLLTAAWMFLLCVFAFFAFSPIVLDKHGISIEKFGIALKKIYWKDVKKIIRRQFVSFPFRSIQADFSVFDRDFSAFERIFPNLSGPIFFSKEIRELRELTEVLNQAAHEHGIRLYTIDQSNIHAKELLVDKL